MPQGGTRRSLIHRIIFPADPHGIAPSSRWTASECIARKGVVWDCYSHIWPSFHHSKAPWTASHSIMSYCHWESTVANYDRAGIEQFLAFPLTEPSFACHCYRQRWMGWTQKWSENQSLTKFKLEAKLIDLCYRIRSMQNKTIGQVHAKVKMTL